MTNKIALITGATAGIGQATAVDLAKNGYNVIITGRRKERLDELKTKIEQETDAKALSLCFDIQDNKAVQHAIDSIPQEWTPISALINNAGIAIGKDDFQDGDIEDWEHVINTNIKGLIYVTKAILPQMREQNTGHIVNISSIAGKEVYAKGNIYCATKHAVDALTKGMRIDLLKHNIRVTSINPGAVNTEFSTVRFKGDKKKADAVYKGFTPLCAEDIARTITFVLTQPEHVCINDLTITPTAQANTSHTYKQE